MTDTAETSTAAGRETALVRSFVHARTGEECLDDDDFFELGAVSSLFAMELITFLEREFSLTIDVDDLVADNFRSISACAAFVGRRRRP